MRKRAIWTAVMLAMLMLSAFSVSGAYAQSQAQDPLSVVKAFVAALNAQDQDAAQALFADDAVFTSRINDQPVVYSGSDEIRKQFLDTFPPGSNLEIIGEPQVAGDKVNLVLRFTADELKSLGLDYVDLMFEVTVQDGKIHSMVATVSPEERAKIDKALGGGASGGMMPTGGMSGGGTMPTGMPTTGSGSQNVLLPLLALLALSFVLTGSKLTRRKA